MPKVADVSGVSVMFYANEQPPPHFRAVFAEHIAVIDIDSLRVTEGFLPIYKRRHVLAWAAQRQDALRRCFRITTSRGKVGRIE
jgi:hypothetical protein